MAEDGSGYGYEYYGSYGSHLSTDTEDAVSQSERSISREPPADAAAAAAAGGPPNSRQPSRQPTEDPSLQTLAEAKYSSSEPKYSSDAYGTYTDPAENYPEGGARASAKAVGSLEPAQDSTQSLSQTQSNTRSNASPGASAVDSYYSYTDDGSGVQPSPSRRGKGGEAATKPSVSSGLSSGMGSSGLSRGSFSDGGQSSGAISIGPSVSEPGRAARLRTKGDLARLDQEGLGLAAAGQEQSSYYSDYEYYSDYYAQHAGNQQEEEEYPLVDVAVQLNKPMGIVFEALQPEEEGGIRVVQLMKGSDASERLKLHDVLTSLNGQPARQLPVSHLMSMLKASASPVAMVFTRRDSTQPPLLPPAAAAAAAIAAAATPPPLPPLPIAAAPALPTDAAGLASLPRLASPSALSEQPTASSSLQSASAPAGAAAAQATAGSRQPSAAGSRQPSAYSAVDVAAPSASAVSQPPSQPPAPYSIGAPSAEGYSARTGSGVPVAAEHRATSTGPLPQASADAFPTLLPLEFAPGLLEDVFERAPPLDASQVPAALLATFASMVHSDAEARRIQERIRAAQEERTSSLIPTRDALALEAAELRKFTPTKPLAEITEEIKTEVAARRQKEGEVKRVKEKITTINARVRQLASQKRAPLPADMQKAVKTLGSVEVTAQQSALLTKQMAESGAQQGWLPS